MLAADQHLSSAHFEVVLGEKECFIRDLKSTNGTAVNGATITKATLHDGDTIVAGETMFRVTLSAGETPVPTPHPSITHHETPLQRLLGLFRHEYQPLFAILDASRDERITTLLSQSKDEHLSLYKGEESRRFSQVAPYLVRLETHSPLLGALVVEGWSKGWGVYLSSSAALENLRRHLRQFLDLSLPDGKKAYFRFYDPRILRAWLPECTLERAQWFFGPVAHYLLEDETPNKLLQFSRTEKEIDRKVIELFTPGVAGSESTPSDIRLRTEPLP
jgi:hypothetical protein